MIKREKIRVKIQEISPYDTPIEDYFKRIQDNIKALPSFYDKTTAHLDFDYEEYGDGHAVWLTAIREETDKEYNQRLERLKQREEYQRHQYEELKKKFEPK